MIKISEIRQRVIEKLKQEEIGLQIEAFPNRPSEYSLTHPEGAVLIAFDGLNLIPPHINQQAFTVSLTANILFSTIIESSEMLDKLDLIRQSITNDIFLYGSRFYCVSQMPLGEKDNIWYYKQKYILPGIIMQGD